MWTLCGERAARKDDVVPYDPPEGQRVCAECVRLFEKRDEEQWASPARPALPGDGLSCLGLPLPRRR